MPANRLAILAVLLASGAAPVSEIRIGSCVSCLTAAMVGPNSGAKVHGDFR